MGGKQRSENVGGVLTPKHPPPPFLPATAPERPHPKQHCFDYKLVEGEVFGSRNPDGNWTGMMGELQRNEIDITFPVVARSLHRDTIGDPTSGIFYRSVVILVGRTSATESNILGYLLTFDVDVWIYLLCSMVLLSLLATLLHMASCRMRRMSSNALELLSHYVQIFFENMFCEASPEPPSEEPVRVLSAVWWIAVVVLMNAFAGQMRACLMVRSEATRIRTVADVNAKAEAGGLLPYTLGKTEIERVLKHSRRQDYQNLWRTMKRLGTLLDHFYYFSDKMLTDVAAGKAVIMHADGFLQIQYLLNGPEQGTQYNAHMYLLQELQLTVLH
ncbi:glutamate receptor U1-like [Amblyomma americanum]